MQTRIRLASDVGGTFTDVVTCITDAQSGALLRLDALKVDTTPGDFERGVMEGTRQTKVDLAQVESLFHGATVVINALTERKGVKTGLITTRGFRDVLEIARGNRPDLFNFEYRKPSPFVPRYLRREVTERTGPTGAIVTPPALSELGEIVADFRREGVEAVAICFLHAYANPSNEIAVAAEVARLWPGLAISASNEVTRQWREYERTNTTVLNAYVRPIATRYLERLESELSSQGFRGAAYVMQSNAGVTTFGTAKRTPITLVESGPACGVLAAAAVGKSVGASHVLALDIGGTTAKCALIENGQVRVHTDYFIERNAQSAGYPILTPVVDIVEIGNGGGSIAWLDSAGRMQVGPRSAGALPGPVAYGRGGDQPTTTDANLLLGRIDPALLCGGQIDANMEAVRAAFERLGKPLGLDAEATARGVIRIANHNMIRTLKLVSVSRGYDPRDFTLIAFGGGGPLHAATLASELRIPRVVIPVFSPVFSALGMLLSDIRQDFHLDRIIALERVASQPIAESFATLERAALARISADGVATERIRFERYLKVRYAGQDHAVDLPLPGVTPDLSQAIGTAFALEYERRYTYVLDKPVEIIGFHLIGFGEVPKVSFKEIPGGGVLSEALKGQRTVDFDVQGILTADVYDRAALRAGMTIPGPAVIEESGSSTILTPGSRASLDRFGNLLIQIAAG